MKRAILLIAALSAVAGFGFWRHRHPGRRPAEKPRSFAALRILRDLPYAPDDPAQPRSHRLDLYLPAQDAGFPVLLFVHGGSWVGGDKADGADLGRALGTRGIGVATVNYRLSPAVRHPAHIGDVAHAFAWLRANITAHGGRADRLFVCGHSAGGHLVALLGTDERYLEAERLALSDIRGVIPISGDYSIRPGRWREVFGDGPGEGRDPSPLAHVGESRPPFLILFAENDSPGVHRQSQELCAALLARASEAAFLEIKDRGHASILRRMADPGDPALDAIVRFIGGHSGAQPTPSSRRSPSP